MKRFFVVFSVFLLIDLVWLTKVSPKFYQSNIGHLMADKVNFIPAIIFYVVYIIALLVFIVNPGVESQNIWKTLYLAALLGFAMYGTYDLTNMATLKNWPAIVTIVDLLWGTCITTATCLLSIYIITKFNW